MQSEQADTGISYSVQTPSGIRLTICKPAAAEGSACLFAYFAHRWSDPTSNHNRSAD